MLLSVNASPSRSPDPRTATSWSSGSPWVRSNPLWARANPAVLAALSETMIHRGPDSAGSLVDGPVGLAMRRLRLNTWQRFIQFTIETDLSGL